MSRSTSPSRSGGQPTNVAVQLGYRSSVISIPGSGNDVTVRQRVRFAPPLPNSFSVNDLDYAVDITSQRSVGPADGPAAFATRAVRRLQWRPDADRDDLSCVVLSCMDGGNAIPAAVASSRRSRDA